MKKIVKKSLTLVLSTALLVSSFTATAFADSGKGHGNNNGNGYGHEYNKDWFENGHDNRDKNGDGTTAGIGGLGGFGSFGSLDAIGDTRGTGSGTADSDINAQAHETAAGETATRTTTRKTASKSATGKTATEAGSTIERNAILIADCLEDAWVHGSSPMERLRLAVEECESTERSAIEQAAARLSVQLLAPTGLCFLPSFILIGIIPAIASFAA